MRTVACGVLQRSVAAVAALATAGCALDIGLPGPTRMPEMSRLGGDVAPAPVPPAAANSDVAKPPRAVADGTPVRRRLAEVPRAPGRATDEAEMLARARAEADAGRAAEAQRLEADREAELARLSERMRRAGEARRADLRDAAAKAAEPAASEEPPRRSTAAASGRPAQVRFAVLLVMDAGTRGIRRFEKTGDPLLCGAAGCYVSTGPGSAATYLAGRKAFGFLNTMGARAGACRQSLGCVFRGVDLAAMGGMLQPVDMRLVRHDRREQRQVTGDSGCRLASGWLDCRRPVISADYRLWVVPEELAEAAGARVLAQAVAEGLPDWRQAALGPR